MGISQSVRKVDNLDKANGFIKYVDDIVEEGMLYGKLLRSDRAFAEIVKRQYPTLAENYYIVDYKDVPTKNRVHIVFDDMPVFAEEKVCYIGDPILLVVGPDQAKVQKIIEKIVITYRDLTPVIDFEKSDEKHFEYHYDKGDVDSAFKEADLIVEECFETGRQEQAYLETQGLIAIYNEGQITVRGSMQCPYYVLKAVSQCLGEPFKHGNVAQEPTGGAFGGKEDYPSILACQVAVAAYKAQKSVKVVFDRREDITATSKKHPSKSRYKVAVKNKEITAMEIFISYDGGAYKTLSSVVLMRGIISATGVYTIDNLRVGGDVKLTHTVPNGAFRGFGGPQVFFAIESMMNHVADRVGEMRLAFKQKHLSKQGDITSTSGRYHFPIYLPDMLARIEKMSDYSNKKMAYRTQMGRYHKGIGLSMYFHGGGFTGTGERDLIKALVKLKKHADNTVEILVANTDMGQGIYTTLSKMVGNVLEIPYDKIVYKAPDTHKVPDSGPTVASRSVMVVGSLLEKAAKKLKEQWQDGITQIIEQRYHEPDYKIPFDGESFKGDAYPNFSWAVVVVELEVDTLTGQHTVLNTWGQFDVGLPIDENIVIGQLEGGVVQGLAHSSMEVMPIDNLGRIRNNSFTDYILPTAKDFGKLYCTPFVPAIQPQSYVAKGCGELPVVGVAAAYIEALEQCIGKKINHIPVTIEQTLTLLEEADNV